MILKFPRSLSNIPLIFFFQNLHEYYSKLIHFSNFRCTFSTVPQSFIDILSIFFQRFTRSLMKITVEVCLNFFSGLLKNFLASFRSDLKFF